MCRWQTEAMPRVGRRGRHVDGLAARARRGAHHDAGTRHHHRGRPAQPPSHTTVQGREDVSRAIVHSGRGTTRSISPASASRDRRQAPAGFRSRGHRRTTSNISPSSSGPPMDVSHAMYTKALATVCAGDGAPAVLRTWYRSWCCGPAPIRAPMPAGRPGVPEPGLRGQRDQCHCPADVHRLDHQPG